MGSKYEAEKKFQGLSQRWASIIDNARYLDTEYIQKEKEYGINWRAAYKVILHQQVEKLVAKFDNPLSGQEAEPFKIIFAIVEKDFKDAQTFINGKQIDMLEMLNDNLKVYEEICNHLRQLLKKPELRMENMEKFTTE